MFQPFLRFWAADVGRLVYSINLGVSTLLEILVASTNATVTQDFPGMFQPFLRFWGFWLYSLTEKGKEALFQPFLRFWLREIHPLREVHLLVSTLLEILGASIVSL